MKQVEKTTSQVPVRNSIFKGDEMVSLCFRQILKAVKHQSILVDTCLFGVHLVLFVPEFRASFGQNRPHHWSGGS